MYKYLQKLIKKPNGGLLFKNDDFINSFPALRFTLLKELSYINNTKYF